GGGCAGAAGVECGGFLRREVRGRWGPVAEADRLVMWHPRTLARRESGLPTAGRPVGARASPPSVLQTERICRQPPLAPPRARKGPRTHAPASPAAGHGRARRPGSPAAALVRIAWPGWRGTSPPAAECPPRGDAGGRADTPPPPRRAPRHR